MSLGPENALDHVVVVMFENRSFDNLLGHLYEPGEVPSFEGVIGKDLSNPIPDWLDDRPDPAVISYGVAGDMNTPSPDPGEELHHINTQLFGLLDEANRGQMYDQGTYNTPPDGQAPSMDGFVTDYASMLLFEHGRMPTYEEYSRIMCGYTPGQLPVLSGLARGFATFDHWFCDVPTCTFPNRSFFHAGTSSGFVTNFPPGDKFPAHNTGETLFDRLDAAGLSWRIYCDPPCHASLTGMIHASRLFPKFGTNVFSTTQFFEDCAAGNLPAYSFIEPQIIGWAHNDMHPPFTYLFEAVARSKGIDPGAASFDPPSSLLGGEDLLARIYHAIRSSTANGSNHLNTTLLVTFDEHGGTYDHVPPPAVIPPDGKGEPGEMDFTFNRLGVRIPTLAISAWIPEKTVVTQEHRATSVLATLQKRWNLGQPLTARVASARPFDDVFTLPTPRSNDDWPEVTARPVPPLHEAVFPLDAPLGMLGKALVGAILGFGKQIGLDVPEVTMETKITGAEGLAAAQGVLAHLFPNLQESKQ